MNLIILIVLFAAPAAFLYLKGQKLLKEHSRALKAGEPYPQRGDSGHPWTKSQLEGQVRRDKKTIFYGYVCGGIGIALLTFGLITGQLP